MLKGKLHGSHDVYYGRPGVTSVTCVTSMFTAVIQPPEHKQIVREIFVATSFGKRIGLRDSWPACCEVMHLYLIVAVIVLLCAGMHVSAAQSDLQARANPGVDKLKHSLLSDDFQFQLDHRNIISSVRGLIT